MDTVRLKSKLERGTTLDRDGTLSKASHQLSRTLSLVARALHNVGICFIVVMMLLVVTDVCRRYFFSAPIIGADQLVEKSLGILLAFTLAYTAAMKGHIRVDLLTDRLPQRTQAIINSILSLIGCSLMSLITWRIVLHTKRIMDTGLLIAQVDIPMWPFAGLLVVGFFVFTLVLLAQSLEYLLTAVSK